eukprot:8243773-Pyramimonas_sp.AAC.1
MLVLSLRENQRIQADVLRGALRGPPDCLSQAIKQQERWYQAILFASENLTVQNFDSSRTPLDLIQGAQAAAYTTSSGDTFPKGADVSPEK